MNGRIKALMALPEMRGLDGVLVSSYENVRYLSGFTNVDAMLLITKDERLLFTDSRYSEQAQTQCPAFTVVETGHGISPATELKKRFETRPFALGFEADRQTVAWYEALKNELPHVTLADLGAKLDRLRFIKDEGEIENIRGAQKVTDDAFDFLLGLIRPGMTELEIRAELEYFMAKRGCAVSFDTIIASGPHSSMPHAQPTDRKIQNGDFITMDFGCKYNGYCSDMTRTVAVGHADEEMKKIYQIVLTAQQRALDKIAPGVVCNIVDHIARGFIDQMGYGDCFGHGLGHGFGLLIHEEPRFSPACEETLQPGMCLSVEPGIYLPGKFGVRIEDTVCITKDGMENFTASPKELIIL